MNFKNLRKALLIRPDHNESDAQALQTAGWQVVIEPWLEVSPVPDNQAALKLLHQLQHANAHTWLVFTSPRTWGAWAALVGAETLINTCQKALLQGLQVAAVGKATAASLPDFFRPQIPQDFSAQGLIGMWEDMPEIRLEKQVLLLPGSTIAKPTLFQYGEQKGWQIHKVDVYQTVPVARQPKFAQALTCGEFAAVVLRSPSAAQAVAHFVSVPDHTWVVSVGPSTSAAAAQLGGRKLVLPVVSPAELAAKMAHLG